jgi:hypothetical protein
MRSVPARAYLFLLFSLTATFLWPFRPAILSPYVVMNPVVWFFSIGMMALSVSRFYGVRHAVPAPELFIFLYPFGLYFFVNHLPFQVRALDAFLLSFDYNFGCFEVAIAKLYSQSDVVRAVLGLTYNSLMLAVVLVYLAVPAQVRRRYVVAVALAGVSILPLYSICPGAGPKYLLQDQYPLRVPDLLQPHVRAMLQTLHTAPSGMNAIPSGHFAWALLLFWFSRKYCGKAVQIAAGTFMALTCLSTLGTGEHYIIDLVLSVPFAAAVWALVHRQMRFAGISIVVVFAWLIALREAWALAIPPVFAWILTGLTVAPFVLYRGSELSGSADAAGSDSSRKALAFASATRNPNISAT